MEPTEPRLLRTDRLDLRALEVDDLDFLRQLYADPEVARFIGAERLTGEVIGQQVNRFTDVWRERGHGQSVVVERAGGVAIGRVGLHPWAQWRASGWRSGSVSSSIAPTGRRGRRQ